MLSSSEAGRALAESRPLKPKNCAVCGKPFATVGRGVYCSEACRQRAKYLRNLAKAGRVPSVAKGP